jgi:hypothetical protein
VGEIDGRNLDVDRDAVPTSIRAQVEAIRRKRSRLWHELGEYLEIGEQVPVAVRTRQNMIYGVRRTLDARVVACLTICFRLLGILIKLAGIADARADRRDVGRVNVLLLQAVPRDLGEPGVVHNVLAAAVQVAEALGQVRGDELLQEIVRVWMDVGRVLDP